MQVPDLEDMIEEEVRELSEQQEKDIMNGYTAIRLEKGLEEAKKIMDAADKLNLIQPVYKELTARTWTFKTDDQSNSSNWSPPVGFSFQLTQSKPPARLKAPTLKGSLGDPESFKARPRRRKKSNASS